MANWTRNLLVGLAIAGIGAGGSGLVIAGGLQEKIRKQEETTAAVVEKQREIAEDVSAIKAEVKSIQREQASQRTEAREQARETQSALREILREVKQ